MTAVDSDWDYYTACLDGEIYNLTLMRKGILELIVIARQTLFSLPFLHFVVLARHQRYNMMTSLKYIQIQILHNITKDPVQ